MKKKFLLLISLLFITTQVSASSFTDPILFSQNTVTGWELLAGTSFVTNPASAPTVQIGPYETSLVYLPADNYYKGAFSGISHPALFRGQDVLWQSGVESMTSFIRSGPDPATGSSSLEIINMSKNLMVKNGGSHISWTNTYEDLTRFQIRIWEDTNPIWEVDEKYYHTETASGEYEFDLSAIGFSFVEGLDYTIRIEARKNDTQIDPTGDYDGWAGIINRSNTLISYSHNPVPEPSTIVLLGIGLLGVVGVYRRKTA